MRPLSEIIKMDKISAAHHEAGHAVIFTILGYSCNIFMKRRLNCDVLNEKTWIAKCLVLKIFIPVVDLAAGTVAGGLAEGIYHFKCYGDNEEVDDFDYDIWQFEDWEEDISETDRAGVSDPDQIEEITRIVFPVVKHYWPAVKAVAKAFMRHEFLDADQIWKICEKFANASNEKVVKEMSDKLSKLIGMPHK